jgi:rhamnosyltransferase
MPDESSTSQYRPLVSVVIKTYDDSEKSQRGHDFKQPEALLKQYLIETLGALIKQTLRPHEVLIVDSSVGDGIARLLDNYGNTAEMVIRRIVLPNFSHPIALNLGVREARGEIVSSLSGDATPANEKWLECLVRPLIDPKVAGTYSQQVKRPATKVSYVERFRLWWRYNMPHNPERETPIFANASSAFRRSLAIEMPFDEKLKELEDYKWAVQARDRGYVIVYARDSEVFHSHPLSSLQTLQRMIWYAYGRLKIFVLYYYQKRKQSPS